MRRDSRSSSPNASGDAFRVLGEQRGVYYLYKPAGMPVFPRRAGTAGGAPVVLDAWLAAHPAAGRPSWPAGFEGGIAHRLDNDTSGLLLAAASPQVLEEVRAAFSAGRFAKSYRFVTDRTVDWREHRVDAPLARARRRRGRMVVQRGQRTPHRGRWRRAETILRQVKGPVWEAVIRTGVTHQIRLHAAFVGLALLGDRRYGGRPAPSEAGRPPGVDFLLHHRGLEGAGWQSPRVPVPPWWRRSVAALGGDYSSSSSG